MLWVIAGVDALVVLICLQYGVQAVVELAAELLDCELGQVYPVLVLCLIVQFDLGRLARSVCLATLVDALLNPLVAALHR